MTKATESGRDKVMQILGLETNFHEAGVGRRHAVILLHGFLPGSSASTDWGRVFNRFSARFHVIAPDLPGFGHSDAPTDHTACAEFLVDYLLALLDALPIGKVSLVGAGSGGGLALATAARAPERFERLVLAGTPSGSPVPRPAPRGGNAPPPNLGGMRALMADLYYNPKFLTDEHVVERYRASQLQPLGVDRAAHFASNVEFRAPPAMLAKVSHPALVLHGREDRIVPCSAALLLACALPDANLHVFGECGHFPQIERADSFAALACDHLAAD